jgi:Xaa-Pro dipeptidase
MDMIMPQALPDLPPDFHSSLRLRFLQHFKTQAPAARSLVYLRGASLTPKNDSDVDYPFEQESSFFYLFGVQEHDCEGVIEVDSGRSILFVPQPTEAYLIWMKMLDKEQFKALAKVDEVLYHHEKEAYFKAYSPS